MKGRNNNRKTLKQKAKETGKAEIWKARTEDKPVCQ
jgi:hypothetical protein